jgi:signal peptidase I
VDGKPLAEPYATRDQVTTSRDWIVPAGAYFLVGDNRPASCDSRHYGAVPADAISGKVVAIERGSEKIELD